MKRIFTSFFALVLACITAVPAFADALSLTGISSVVTAPTEETLYVIQGNGQAGQISWLYDNNGALGAEVTSMFDAGPESMKYVWTFEKSGESYAAKNYVTGRYICIEGTSNGGKVKMQDSPFFFTIDVKDEEVAFKNASGQYIDLSYSGGNPVTWSGGVAGSRRMSIYIATVEEVTDLTAALAQLNSVYGTYEDYLDGTATIERGSEIGQYNCSEEVYNTFMTNLQLALDILNEEVEDVTLEMINEVIENIESSYATIMASIVELTIADGNYRVVSALEWTATTRIDTGEVDEDGQPIYQEVTIHPTKAMYATLEGKAMWADIDSTDCRYLWKMTNNAETGLIQMMNIATDGIVATCSQSTQATLTEDSNTELKFQFIQRREDGKIVVTMKPSTGGDYAFLHCNGHSSGSGNAGNIVGWTSGAGASQWILEPVTDEEVAELVEAYAPIKNHELLVSMFQDLIAETEAAIAQAQDDSYITDREGLITSTNQFSSIWTDPQEGSFNNVLSDDANTFWHSNWHNGNVSNHTHYFNVSLAAPAEGDIQCFMRRRGNADNDHITALGVYGSNEESALESETEDGWTELGSYNLSQNASPGKTIYSNVITLSEGYQYLRFYIDGTTTGRGYGHFATFQLYRLTVDGNTQWSQMGDAATAISEALATAKAVDPDEMADMTEYNELKAALDAFKALLVDPSALAAALEANKDIVNLVAIGDNPGFWSADSEVGALASIIQEASAYLKSGAYTQAQVDAYVEAITSGASNIMAAANPVVEGKWYALKFDSEENYDAHKWSKTPAVNTTLGDLYNNYAAPANIDGEGDDATLVGLESLADVSIGQAVRFIDDETIQQMDQVAFRFVAQGDSAFVIQHKSGLYLGGASRSTNLTLGLTPALFNVQAVGYGKVIIEARNLKGQGYYSEPVYLHAQNAGHSLVTWNNDVVSSNSALFIEPIDDSDFDEGTDVQESFSMKVKSNSFIFKCYPAGFSVEGAEIYAYQGAIPDGDKANYAFNKVEQAEPGQPVLLVVGDYENFEADDEEEDPEVISITPLGSSFALDPIATGGVHGTFAYEWVDKGTVVVGGGRIGSYGNSLVLADGVENTDCTRDIAANTGYIVFGENILKDGKVEDFDLVINADKPVIKGDVNNDFAVTIADGVAVLNAMAGEEVAGVADVNGDGEVTIADFVAVLNIMAEQ